MSITCTISARIEALVSNTDEVIFSANASRRYLRIVNLSITPTAIGFGAAADSSSFRLAGYNSGSPPGEGSVLEFSGDFVPQDEIHAMSIGGNGSLSVAEG